MGAMNPDLKRQLSVLDEWLSALERTQSQTSLQNPQLQEISESVDARYGEQGEDDLLLGRRSCS